MDATAILDRLDSLGVSVEVVDDRLRLSPGSHVPPDLIDELKAHKHEVILKLNGYRLKYPEPQATDEELDEIAQRVATEGYILLWSQELKDLVAFYRDGQAKSRIPPGFVSYSVAELMELRYTSLDTFKVIHEAKRHGSRVISSEFED